MVRMCDFRFPDRLTNELRKRMRISANIEDLIVHNRMRWYEHILCPRMEKQKEMFDLEKRKQRKEDQNKPELIDLQ